MRPRAGPCASAALLNQATAMTNSTVLAINFMPNLSDTGNSANVFADDRLQTLFRFRGDLVGRCNNSMAQRLPAFAGALGRRKLSYGGGDQLLSVLGIVIQVIDDHL